MVLRKAVWGVTGGLIVAGALFAALPFREYPGVEYNDFPLPPDFQEKTEWVFARLMYPPAPTARFDRSGSRNGGSGWTLGYSSWTQDYPRADRHFVRAVRRLTRLHTRSVEQPVNLDDGDVFDWPWLYAVRTGEWRLSDNQAKALREYLLRGGFLFVDDFWGTPEWAVFMQSLRKVFPDRQPAEIQNSDQIFHSVYDLNDRYQVPGAWGIGYGGRAGYQNDGDTPYWRAIYDDRGRVMVAIVMNSDLGDSWEYADDPYYPEKYSALGIRTGVNYVIYAMTH
ncbi:MAG: hypothetical protein C5B51_04545 [Terriglobia bacterium]|nr:MAG: hypothetical protein C5B51_04545 [Terriglobia bacterium]